jgi:hypothetical protein
LGHLEKMEEKRMPKTIFSKEMEGINEGEGSGKGG